MSQEVIQDSSCGNGKFRKCVVDSDTKICVNCKKSFVEEGDYVVMACRECTKVEKIKIEGFYTSPDRTPYGYCDECIENESSVEVKSLYAKFVWSSETEQEKTWQEVAKLEEQALEEIVNLPKSQIKTIFRKMNRGIER